MIRFEDLIDKVRANAPDADVDRSSADASDLASESDGSTADRSPGAH